MSDVLSKVQGIVAEAPVVLDAPTDLALVGEAKESPVKKAKYPRIKDFEDHAITETVEEFVAWLDPSGKPPQRLARTTGASYAATWAVLTDGEADLHPGWVALVSTVMLGLVLGLKIWKNGGIAAPTEEPAKPGGLGIAANLQ